VRNNKIAIDKQLKIEPAFYTHLVFILTCTGSTNLLSEALQDNVSDPTHTPFLQ